MERREYLNERPIEKQNIHVMGIPGKEEREEQEKSSKSVCLEDGEMSQWLSAVLPEDMSSLPTTHTMAHHCL